MHESVMTWTAEVLSRSSIAGRTVLEVGAYDVNGSVRPIVEALGPASYIGVDQSEGPGVDHVCDAIALTDEYGVDAFDLVICTEMFEHVQAWEPVLVELVRVLSPGGLLLITTRSEGFPYHPYPIDAWRYSEAGIREMLEACNLRVVVLESDPQAPGVFALALKPPRWKPPRWLRAFDAVTGVTAMVQP